MNRVPEPWMFNTEVTMDGVPIRGEVGRFTFRGRLRMALRLLRGKPPIDGVLLTPKATP
jgi:hypothetical protein